MKTYKRYHYPSQIISHAVWLYHRFTLSFRDIEDILGDEWYLDEVFIKLNGKVYYLWRAVDQDGCELDSYLNFIK